MQKKPQRGRKAAAPLHTPRAFFRSSWLWMREGVDLCLYAWVLDVGRCADSGSCILRYWMRGAVPIYFFGDTAGCFIGYGLF